MHLQKKLLPYRNSKDLQTLRCQERQMLKLVEIIKTALNEIGCEELPSGCDDVIEQTFIDSNLSHDHPVSKLQKFPFILFLLLWE